VGERRKKICCSSSKKEQEVWGGGGRTKKIINNHTSIIGARERGGGKQSFDSVNSVPDSKEILHFIIGPLSFDEAQPLVAGHLRGPALVFTREMVPHEVPDGTSDDGDGVTTGDVEEGPVLVDSYTTTEELTCMYKDIQQKLITDNEEKEGEERAR
jgi:hypothetical protein